MANLRKYDARWISGTFTGEGFIIDDGATLTVGTGSTLNSTQVVVKSAAVDGATAVAVVSDSVNALSNATAKLFSFRNAGVEKLSVRYDGTITWPVALGAGLIQFDASTYVNLTSTQVQMAPGASATVGTIVEAGACKPGSDNAVTLGLPATRWSQTWSYKYAGPETTLAFSATPAWNPANSGEKQRMVLTANVTSWTIASGLEGEDLELHSIQDGTGGWTIAGPPANVKLTAAFGGGDAAGFRSILKLTWDNALSYWVENGRSIAVAG
jgi:hypothetical protein